MLGRRLSRDYDESAADLVEESDDVPGEQRAVVPERQALAIRLAGEVMH